MTEIDIRAAAPDEAQALADTHRAADWETYAPLFGPAAKPIGAGATLARWRDGLESGDIVLAAVRGATIVGVAHIKGDLLRALYLKAAHHRQGVGRRLLGAALAAARDRGVATIRFNVVENNDRAIAFYEALGARRVGRSLQRDDDGDEWWEYDYLIDTPR
jgi:ribosomal protein S18 acetylase RimI-like enzyme